jgi:hypothetical protein
MFRVGAVTLPRLVRHAVRMKLSARSTVVDVIRNLITYICQFKKFLFDKNILSLFG